MQATIIFACLAFLALSHQAISTEGQAVTEVAQQVQEARNFPGKTLRDAAALPPWQAGRPGTGSRSNRGYTSCWRRGRNRWNRTYQDSTCYGKQWTDQTDYT
ncbi:hypothetical protein PSHT_12636 [Puccinia striiformis]|uniref:Secreted protein n=1 Tax=Puccinia striiformis TaxID=27350 RepID=A0A2S4UVK3_9BASI|nr:hypothetical protein PSHT_12636 [Puccinia striiformis]